MIEDLDFCFESTALTTLLLFYNPSNLTKYNSVEGFSFVGAVASHILYNAL